GHVGDGNFHMLVLFDPQDAASLERAESFGRFVAHTALSHDGTISGEHGIGTHKRALMVEEHDEAALRMMTAIKRALDPHDLANPGKLLP
ncbi:MAG: FAD-linked oxidase C-terminal domain-containing protein, partial [Pseudomonadota bacterium]